MNERLPVKQLFELKMTNWYLSRTPRIKEAINNYPPGYYVFSGNGETYRLVGWSEPNEKNNETEAHIFIERKIPQGTERLRVHPNYISPEEEILELNRAQQADFEAAPYVVAEPIGYNIGKTVNGEIKFLMIPTTQERRHFHTIAMAKQFLLDNGMAIEEQLEDFVYEPTYS